MALLGAFRPLLGGKLDKASLVIDYIEKRAGLLVGQGVRQHQRQFTFPHRTFQEYLAACYLAAQNDFSERSTELVQDTPAHWREDVVLAARTAGKERGLAAADALIHGQSCDEYRRQGNVPRETDWQAAILAGAQLLEIGLAVVESRDVYRAVRDRVTNWLLRLIETPHLLPLAERIEAGNTVGRLGDPRFEVRQAADGTAYILPNPVRVAAGPFEMGSKKGEPDSYDDEYSRATKNKRHSVQVAEFLISPYPVTNAEYRLDGIRFLTIDERLAIANMTTEWGALAGVFPIDLATILWLRRRESFIEHRGLEGVFSDADGKVQHPRIYHN